jgi:FixJ family two-component response regulator
VFVVDDDVSVRESLELLILSAGWQPETFGADCAAKTAELSLTNALRAELPPGASR